MHARNVRLTAAGFTLALFALAGAAAWRVDSRKTAAASSQSPDPSPAPSELDGRALYEQHCASCHALDEFAKTYQGPGSGVAVLELLEFLVDHGGATTDEDRAIARFLAAP